jgi:hypothetical protein
MSHIAQLIEQSSEAVVQVKVAQGHVMMEIMKDASFSQEQKMKLVEHLKPLDAAISTAQSSFVHDVVEK